MRNVTDALAAGVLNHDSFPDCCSNTFKDGFPPRLPSHTHTGLSEHFGRNQKF